MLTKGAIGNLVNRYRAVLKKCNLINTFGSLAVASMLVLGGAGVANALVVSTSVEHDTLDVSYNEKLQLQNGVVMSYKDKAKLDSVTVEYDVVLSANSELLTKKLTANGLNNLTSLDVEELVITAGSASGTSAGGYLWNTKGASINAKSITVENNVSNDAASITVDDFNVGTYANNKSGASITVNNFISVSEELRNAGDVNLNNATAEIGAIVAYKEDAGHVKMNKSSLSLDKNSTIGKMQINESSLEIADGATVEVDELSGSSASATIGASVNEDGTVSSGSLVATKSDLETLSVAYNGINADNFANTDAAAEFAQNSVQLGDNATTEVSGVIEGGNINGDITIDGDGNASMGKNELMDAALQQASINTVALDRILTNDVRKRMGDLRSDANKTGVWMRWDGGKLKGDSGLTNNFNTIQIGGDTKVAKNCRLGVAGSFTHGDTDFSRGNGELEGFSFAAYATWMGDNGMFADVVARLGHFSTEMNVDGMKGDMDNRVASISGEYGWRFNLCDQFFVEPQVELAYTYVSSEDLELGDNHYEFDNVDSLTGRAGVVAGWNLPGDRGNVYARASVVQQFMGDAKISGTNGIANNVQEIDGDDTWFEYGIGANVKLTDNTYIWADVERTEGAEIDEEWRGTVGVRFSF